MKCRWGASKVNTWFQGILLLTGLLAFGPRGHAPRIRLALPEVTVTPTSLAFGVVRMGTTSTLDFTVTNDGTTDLTYSVSEASTEISITTSFPGASGVLAAGAFVTIHVKFDPTSLGLKTGDLTVTTDDADEPTTLVSFTGTGGRSFLVVDSPATPNNFVDQPLGTASTPVTVTVRNDVQPNVAPLNIGSIVKAGTDPTEFTVVDAAPYTNIASGSTVTFSVAFTPTRIGPATCTLQINSDDPGSPTLFVVTGNALPAPAPAPSGGGGGGGCGLSGLEAGLVFLLLALRRRLR